MVLGLCVCLSVRHHESCHYAQLSVQPKVPTASVQSGKLFFSLKMQKLWREKANKLISTLYVLTATLYGANGATFRQKFRRQGPFWFFQSLTAGYKLPGMYRAFAFVVFRILSVTCSLMRALSQSFVHTQQLFSVSTPGRRGFAL